jgi:hypothetical protein
MWEPGPKLGIRPSAKIMSTRSSED